MEHTLWISLQTIDVVKKYVDIVSKCGCDIIIISGKLQLDGKSIMSLFSLDLLKPIEIIIKSNNKENILSLHKKLEDNNIISNM